MILRIVDLILFKFMYASNYSKNPITAEEKVAELMKQRDAAVAERDRLRAEVEELKGRLESSMDHHLKYRDNLREDLASTSARAELAEHELADHITALKISNRSADEQMRYKREAESKVEQLNLELTALGNLAVGHWDDPTVGRVDALIPHETQVTYKEQLKTLFSSSSELARIRSLFPAICKALGNGAFCTSDVSVEFLESIPNEVSCVVTRLRTENECLKALGSWTHTCIHHTDTERKAGVTCPVCAIAELTAAKAECKVLEKTLKETTRGAGLLAESHYATITRLRAQESDYVKMIAEVLKCEPRSACEQSDNRLEAPWDVIARLRTENERLKARLYKGCDDERDMAISEGPSHGVCGLASELTARAEKAEAELRIAQNWVDHHSQHADDLIAQNVKLREALEQYRNCVIVGGTNPAKTTLNELDQNENI
jgi:uncharacterized protein YhaN